MSLFEGINRADIYEYEPGVSPEFKHGSTARQVPKNPSFQTFKNSSSITHPHKTPNNTYIK